MASPAFSSTIMCSFTNRNIPGISRPNLHGMQYEQYMHGIPLFRVKYGFFSSLPPDTSFVSSDFGAQLCNVTAVPAIVAPATPAVAVLIQFLRVYRLSSISFPYSVRKSSLEPFIRFELGCVDEPLPLRRGLPQSDEPRRRIHTCHIRRICSDRRSESCTACHWHVSILYALSRHKDTCVHKLGIASMASYN